jgi:very-short-patch-repair endonuclease
LDFALEEIKLGVEIDGAATHSTPEARRHDRLRDRALRRRGWQIERFTTEDVRQTPGPMVRHTKAIMQASWEARPRSA